MSVYDDTITHFVYISHTELDVGVYSAVGDDDLTVTGAFAFAYAPAGLDRATLTDTAVYRWVAGAVMQDLVTIGGLALSGSTYVVTIKDLQKFHDAFVTSAGVAVAEGFTLRDAYAATLGLLVTERAKLSGEAQGSATYQLLLTQAFQIAETFAIFANLDFQDTVTIDSSLADRYLAVADLFDRVMWQDFAGNPVMLFNLMMTETAVWDDTQIIKMIYAGDPLLDTIDLRVLYVSPSGNTTTFVINTRTTAISEYQNWAFNSFASMGSKYIAADEHGLYELNGERDLTENIVSDMKSGLAQLNASKLAGLKGVYLGLRGQGEYVLKIEAGDGREYVYAIQSQPNFMTTKVNIGKGLRSRYFSWELISTGPDFDLESIEFVPMYGKRRV